MFTLNLNLTWAHLANICGYSIIPNTSASLVYILGDLNLTTVGSLEKSTLNSIILYFIRNLPSQTHFMI